MLTADFLRALVDADYDVGNVGLQVHLYKTDIALSPNLLLEAFTEADYTGYASAVKLSAGTAFSDPGGNAIMALAAFQIRPTGDAVPNTLYGYFLEGVALGPFEGLLVGAYRFKTPITVVDPTTAWWLIPLLAIGQAVGDIDVTPT